ncbi:MAG TPA: 1,4-dihydroxy-2-naphthoate octaprenyltransferase [Peptococcaceae bacterium]|nr:MAG: 1,4-dihydroxy-2-naphthoate octaprenyltransferase [Clostridia bacterium 41_269]HBT19918.1 1,4-dihydroxy-2-naphthoate octaprenyltransferase [Peptococcaceae bacterium]
MKTFKFWFKAFRAHFFPASIVPVLLGTFLAGYETGEINWLFFTLVLVSALACHSGSNLINDYYDHFIGTDEINQNRTVFNGGSGYIQNKLLPPDKFKSLALICYIISFTAGLVLSFLCGYYTLFFTAAGIAAGYSYSGYPFFGCRGIGELLVGLSFGPLIVTGAFFVQTGYISNTAVISSIPVGLLIAAVLYINQFPDYEADGCCGKRNLVVKLGLKRALPLFYFFIVGAYSTIAVGIVFKVIPFSAAAVFLTLPLAVRAVVTAKNYYFCPKKLLPASMYTVMTHLGLILLLTVVFVWEMLTGRK